MSGALYGFFSLPFLLIKNIEVSGNEVVDAGRIQKIANDMLQEKYFFFFPKSNRLIYPEKEIETKIKQEIGRIEELSLEVDHDTLFIKIGERGAYALWCKDDVSCYFMDSEGLIFSEAPVFSSGVYRIYTGIISDGSPQGKQFLDSEKLSGIESIAEFLKTQGWDTEKIQVSTLRDVVLIQNKGPKIRIDITRPATETLKTLAALLASSEFKKSASNIMMIDYIDLRFGSKVFFKSKGSMLPAAAVTAVVE